MVPTRGIELASLAGTLATLDRLKISTITKSTLLTEVELSMQISLKTFTEVSSVIPFSCRILMLNHYDATGFQQKPNTTNTLLKASQRQQQSRQGIVGCVICISTSGERKQP